LTQLDPSDLPPPIRGTEIGSWAHRSIVDRLPEIGQRVLVENDFPETIASQLKAFFDEIPQGMIRPFSDPAAPDIQDWQRYAQQHQGLNWLEAPWFFIETYFYRHIVAITGFFNGGSEDWLDPFKYQKRSSLNQLAAEFRPPDPSDPMAEHWLTALWGNQTDLSLWPKDDEITTRELPEPAQHRILVDDRPAVNHYLENAEGGIHRIDLILDNAGEELMADLSLVGSLLTRFPQSIIHLHAKAHPTFVSDTTPVDIDNTLASMLEMGSEPTRSLARHLMDGIKDGAIKIRSPYYWTSPLAGWDMPVSLKQDLAQSQLLVYKGDANYRRLLGDRHWPSSTAFQEVVGFMPAPTLALRAMKSELAIGLDSQIINRAAQQDHDWMINGNWGLIQFCQSKADNTP
jgi:hypothetical protein